MGFLQLTNSELLNLCGTTLKECLPQSSLVRNVVILHLSTHLNETVPGSFYLYQTNTKDRTVFLVAKQEKHKYSNFVSWSMFVSNPECVTSEMIHSLEVMIDWTIPNMFYAVRAEMLELFSVMCRKHCLMQDWGPEMVYFLDETFINAIDISALYLDKEPKLALKELDPEEVNTLIKYWEYGHERLSQEVLDSVTIVGSAGLTVNGELVAWAFAGMNGAIHALFTMEGHRGKGYGKIVLQYLGQILAKKGLNATTLVEEHNAASIKLMVNSGFRASHLTRWVECVPTPAGKWGKFLNIPSTFG